MVLVPRSSDSSNPPREFKTPRESDLHHLHVVARRILRCDDLAHDAVQETLLALWACATPPLEARAWLVRTVVHKSLHLARGRRRRVRHEAEAGLPRTEPCPLCDPLLELEETEIDEHVARAVLDLPEHLRAAFVLRHLRGLDYGAVAGLLGVPIGTVRSRLYRAREALWRRLSSEFGVVARDVGTRSVESQELGADVRE